MHQCSSGVSGHIIIQNIPHRFTYALFIHSPFSHLFEKLKFIFLARSPTHVEDVWLDFSVY